MFNSAENNQVFEPVADFIKLHVGAVSHERIISIEKKESKTDIFSCVFVQNDSRYYALTARHCLEDLCDSSRIRISTFNHQWPGEIIPLDFKDNVNFGMSKNKRIDICYLELDEKTAKSLKVNFFPSYNSISQAYKHYTRVCLIGFPTQFLEQNFISNSSGKAKFILLVKPFICWTNISKRIPEETSALDYQPDLNFDIYLEYDPRKIHDVNTDNILPDITPQGMSGCGVFEVPIDHKDKIWNASDIKLIGIQSSYYPGNKLLKATKIEHLFEILKQ